MFRVSQKILEQKLDKINNDCNLNYELNFASCYGGYQLTSNEGSKIIVNRLSGVKMFSYLQGFSDCFHTVRKVT